MSTQPKRLTISEDLMSQAINLALWTAGAPALTPPKLKVVAGVVCRVLYDSLEVGEDGLVPRSSE